MQFLAITQICYHKLRALLKLVSILILLLMSLNCQAKPVQIVFWYSLAGKLGEEVRNLINHFNQSQSEYVIKPIYKGDYLETLTSFAAAFQAKKTPALVQIFEVGTNAMLTPQGIIKPVDEVMTEANLTLPTEDFFPVIRAQYSKNEQLMAMPFNISIPVIFYNKEALAKVGYDESKFPQTWAELEVLASQLVKSGFSCTYTSAYPAWLLIESYSALHGLSMVENQRAVYNNKAIVNHLQRLRHWQQLHYFEYGGRTDDATVLFTSGRCPLISQSSGGYTSLAAMVSFKVGIAPIPLDTGVSAKRYNNVAGGAAIWAVAGHSPKVYRGIAKFFAFLAKPEVQQEWHKSTGYLPIGVSGIYRKFTENSKHPALVLARTELAVNGSSVVLLGVQNQIRKINDETLEAIFSGIKEPQTGMDYAVDRANHALIRFKKNTSA